MLNRQVEDVKGIMAQNIEKVVERGDRLDSLLEKTQDLEQAVCSSYLEPSAKN